MYISLSVLANIVEHTALFVLLIIFPKTHFILGLRDNLTYTILTSSSFSDMFTIPSCIRTNGAYDLENTSRGVANDNNL